jgi:hypothetical protein
MGGVSARCNNAAAQNFRNNLGWLAGAIDAVISEPIGRQALGVESAEAGFIAKERPAGHSHASRKKHFDGRIQPQNRSASPAEKIRAARLCVGAAAEGENGAFLHLRSAAKGGAELIRLDLAE